MATSRPTNLFEYYSSIGATLPSLATRAKLYEAQGLGPAGEYKGTAEQNTRLLAQLNQQSEPEPPGTVDTAESLRDQYKPSNPHETVSFYRAYLGDTGILERTFYWLGTDKLLPGDAEWMATQPGSMNVWDWQVLYAKRRWDLLDFGPRSTDLPPEGQWSEAGDSSYPAAKASPLFERDPLSGDWKVRGVNLSEAGRMGKDAVELLANQGRDTFVETIQRGATEEVLEVVESRVPAPLFGALMKLKEAYDEVSSLKDVLSNFHRRATDYIFRGIDAVGGAQNGFDVDEGDRITRELNNDLIDLQMSRNGETGSLLSRAIGNVRTIFERSEARSQGQSALGEFGPAATAPKETWRVLSQDTTVASGLTVPGGKQIAVLAAANGDTVTGGDLSDLLIGQGGNDSFHGGAGDDLLQGGDGNDQLFGGAGTDTLYGGSGNDVLGGAAFTSGVGLAADGADSIESGDGNDFLYGNNGNDTLRGGPGNDLLRGDAGNDVLDGGPGDDRVSYRFDETAALPGGVAVAMRFDGSAIGSAAQISFADGLGSTSKPSPSPAATWPTR
jgi:hypothetical protein